MSDPDTHTTVERSAFFRPRTFLLGIVVGLSLCSALARFVSHRGYHETFTRFHPAISPEAQYYPTLEEMCGIIRMRCRPDQILVIVGGNSIFNGVGQPADKMWTGELQSRLGDKFVVVNMAFRGALCTDGGAVVAEVLRKEYPRQIYVANAAPFVPPYPYGLDPYRYIVWEARSRGLLEPFAARDDLILDYDSIWGDRFELWGKGWLDRGLRFHDLWNWVGYEYFFTVNNPVTPHLMQAVFPRKDLEDDERDFNDTAFSDRFRAENNGAEMNIVRAFSEHFLFKSKRGEWLPIPYLRMVFEDVAKGAFPNDLKARTLIMLSRNSPFYLRKLTADELEREDAAYRAGVSEWQKMGYAAADYGRDYKDEDFGDRAHLTVSGGSKLSAQVADQVRGISLKLGYLDPEPARP